MARELDPEHVLALFAWARRGQDEEERRSRFGKVRAQLFPEDLTEEERAAREALLEELGKEEERKRDQFDPMPSLQPKESMLPPLEWDGFVTKKSDLGPPDQIVDELKRMQTEATGSPFFARERPKPPAPALKKPTSRS